MAQDYYYLGRSMGMTRIPGHNAFICVDTRSLESFSYIAGIPLEPDEVSVMLRFVGPKSHFVDIGANFGLYSMIASEKIGPQGSLTAFEANPHTYEYLKYSAISNRLPWQPYCKFENFAVSDHAGTIEFAFDPEGLGGGHVRTAGEYPKKYQFVVVPCIRLDDYFGPDKTIDFAKIDVEGHELAVLQGMQEIIRRSPNIRLLIEYLTGSDEITERGQILIDFIRSLGLSLCQVRSGGFLTVVPDDVIPTGNVYLLATRSPAEDAELASGTVRISPKNLSFHPDYESGKHALLTKSGTIEFDGAKSASVADPMLFHGPYIELPAGDYSLHIDAEGIGSADVFITSDFGQNRIGSFVVDTWPYQAKFRLAENVRHFEVILHKTDSLERLSLRQLVLTPG